MIDKSIRQYYESGQLVRPGKGRPGYQGAQKAWEELEADINKPTNKRIVKEVTINPNDFNELQEAEEKAEAEFRKKYPNTSPDSLRLEAVRRKVRDDFAKKKSTTKDYTQTKSQKKDLLEGTTLGALKKGREQAGAVDYTEAIIRNAVKQNPEVEGIIKKSMNKAKGLAASAAKNYTDQNTGNITLKSAAKGGAQSFVKNLIGKNLARTGLLTALGPLGLLIGNWAAGKVVDKFTGKKDEGMVSTFFNKIQADGDKFTSKFREPGS